MSETEQEEVDEVEINEYDLEQIQKLVQQEQQLMAQVAELELKINELEQAKGQTVTQLQQIREAKQDEFQSLTERYGIDDEGDWELSDGSLTKVESADGINTDIIDEE